VRVTSGTRQSDGVEDGLEVGSCSRVRGTACIDDLGVAGLPFLEREVDPAKVASIARQDFTQFGVDGC